MTVQELQCWLPLTKKSNLLNYPAASGEVKRPIHGLMMDYESKVTVNTRSHPNVSNTFYKILHQNFSLLKQHPDLHLRPTDL